MKFTTVFVPLAAVFVASVTSIPVKRGVDPDLVPQFGHAAGVNPTGTGDCDGAVNGSDGKPIKVPCACPPDRQTFINDLNANVAAGHVINNPSVGISFPEDNSIASQNARLNAAAVTLQNLNGPGKGCPIVSTTFSAQQDAINAEAASGKVAPAPAKSTAAPAPAKTTAAPAKATPAKSTPAPAKAAPSPAKAAPVAAGAPSAAQITQLAPQLGFTAGKNPTGTGDCDGAVNGADGKPIKIPCACPPTQAVFDQHLVGDVEAGHAVNNPSVKVSYPVDNSVQSQLARINTALVTLQNLNGPGKGCPAVSSTLQAQQKALQAKL
ncbi:hypothetical protein BV25DRAFT_1955567 [Artomyces pyxidatus]|uniref:Uncharacterized protein n=1 Tax=Artomyces pyxidatus TaxID=48021 RepID=A0ACB8SVA0_9AGAM|nr:hypothetical protein BV25DRAFT_1955567 [Artomyces pyxidatus]